MPPPQPDPNEPPALAHPLAIAVRQETRATLLDDGDAWKTRFVLDPASGKLVVNLSRDLATREELVLAAPDEDGVQMLLTDITPLDARLDAACDRWRAFATSSEDFPAFVSARVGSAKSPDHFADDEDLLLACPFHRDEPKLCRELNADPAPLRSLLSTDDADTPLVVGVDHLGFWGRLRFGVRFIAFKEQAGSADHAQALAASALGTSPG